MSAVTYLDAILDHHRQRVADDDRNFEVLYGQALNAEPCRGFLNRLRAESSTTIKVIAEIKRRSPSKGDLRADLDPIDLAVRYESGGASCLSVLTDSQHFGGSVKDLQLARRSVDLAVLRKDFILSPLDVVDTKLMGADCLLLIVAALSDAELLELSALANDLGLDVLVETHDEQELERALALGASLVGVNQRDLVSFEVDTARALRLAAMIPSEVVSVAESGISSVADAGPLAAAGFDALLVGELLVCADDPALSVASLCNG